ncbi:hypothetical protein GIB67_020384 [Kingdonia uniflora]|uniref:DYW domain-containing protein n=1 Tax=Kingdonia uniflora TaxID=39325 RepID=A0A7J7LBK0_9MAGN|nr:hypothetical protein GIB67_020384 [Kingdonia uniflora]
MPFLTANMLTSFVESAISSRSSRMGRAAHAQITKYLYPSIPSFLSNHLVNMYSKLDLLNSAQLVLWLSPDRSVVTWTALISGSVQNEYFSSALTHFCNMRREAIQPNDFTLPCIFKASASLRSSLMGKQLHSLSIKLGLISDVFVSCSAFDMYCKTGLREDSCKLFDEMPMSECNNSMWNAYISNSVLDGRPQDAFSAFIRFRSVGGESNSITICAFLNGCSDTSDLRLGRQLHSFITHSGLDKCVRIKNGLIDFYGKCQQIESAEMVFDEVREPSDVTWGSMVSAFVFNNEEEKACGIFMQARKENVEPTDYMFSSVLSACAGLSVLEMGRSMHGLAVKACVDERVYVGSALVDMYGKCGNIEESRHAFDELPKRNLVTWNAMMGGYTHQGHADMALALLKEMTEGKEVTPNYVTLVCVLSACSRAGSVKEGMKIFEVMRERYHVEPVIQHYACVVDMLGRAGMVERAYKFIKAMPIRPNISVWGALLGACRVYGNPKLGKIAADNLFEIDPQDSGNRVLLSNMFAAAGRWEEATVVRKEMKDVGIKKDPGCSWISVKNVVHIFQAKDNSHPRNSEIQAIIAKLKSDMKVAGHVPDTNFALHDLEEEEKESEVWSHSEKLALAFGLMCIPRGVPIRITKNLRVCGDCHSAMKFISGIVNREIILRDNNRFHRFKDNQCSCRDYW